MKHMSHGSPASVGASKGRGPMAGAGQLNAPGAFPGPASRRVKSPVPRNTENPSYPTPPGTAPRGMKIYREE